VWERAAGQVVQGALTITALLVFPSPVRPSAPLVAAAVVGAALVLGLLLIRWNRVAEGNSPWTRVRNCVVTDVRTGVLRPAALPAVVLTSAVVVVGHAVTFLIAARTVGVTAPISRLVPLALLALLGMVLPSVGGWGPREGVTAWLFSAAGLGAGRGAAVAVAYGVLVVAASLPGAVVLFGAWLPRRWFSRTRPGRRVAFRAEEGAGMATIATSHWPDPGSLLRRV
jgi:hypothetical protein